MRGRGTYYYANCDAYYSGDWAQGLKHGEGLYFSQEEIYEGGWQHGHRHGNAYHHNKLTQEVYLGQIEQGSRQGKGKLVFPDGSAYSGQFQKDLPNGTGTFEYLNKDKY